MTRVRDRIRARLAGGLTRFGRDERGATAIVLGLSMPVLVVAAGLGAEVGLQYAVSRQLQHTADAAAYSAGVRLRTGGSVADMTDAAGRTVAAANFSAPGVTLDVNYPPESGPNAGDALAVEILLTKNQTRYFSAIYEEGAVPIGARSVVRVTKEGGAACVLSTATDGVGITSTSDLTLDGCDLATNSPNPGSITADKGTAEARCAQTVAATAPYTSALLLAECPAVNTLSPLTQDPYADVDEPEVDTTRCKPASGTKSGKGSSAVVTFEPDYDHPSGMRATCFQDGLKLSGNNTYEFKPGLYIINGGEMQVNGTVELISGLAANGVTFFLTNGATVKFNGTADFDMSAPDYGEYSGMLFFGDRDDRVEHEILGNAGATIRGAVYTPNSNVTYTGSATSTGGCTQIIGNRVTFTGSSKLGTKCDLVGTKDIVTGERVRLVE